MKNLSYLELFLHIHTQHTTHNTRVINNQQEMQFYFGNQFDYEELLKQYSFNSTIQNLNITTSGRNIVSFFYSQQTIE